MTLIRAIVALLALGFYVVAAPPRAAAHDIPNDVIVHVFLKREADSAQGPRVRVLVRVPMRALLDIDFPKRGPDYLDLGLARPALRQAATVWIAKNLTIYEAGARLGEGVVVIARASLPSDRSFASYEDAVAHISGAPLPDATDISWDQALLDTWLEYPIQSDRSDFSIRPAFARLGLRVVTVLRFVAPDGTVRAFEYSGDPGLVTLDPRWHEAALTFVKFGCLHILEGVDHLLFVFCLVIPLRRIRPLILVVTSFTVAHSITLLAAAAGFTPDARWFPPLVEVLIAASIVYMALENIVLEWRGPLRPAPGGAWGVGVRRRWRITFVFGLVHGFGFSFALQETLQFAGSHLLTSLLAFNAGVELGQLLVLAVLVPALHVLFRFAVAERVGTIILSAFVAHTGWHWLAERGERLRQFGWPALDAGLLASGMRWAMVLLAVAAAIWISRAMRRQSPIPDPRS